MVIKEIRSSINNSTQTANTIIFKRKFLYNFIKRAFDIIASLMALTILAAPIIIIAVLVKIDSPGGIIYKQERLTKNGKPFMLYKFRTMCQDAEKDGAKWADENDSRVTRVGHYLRAFRLDEILQFVNSLKGDISIVGPRPEREIFHNEFCKDIENWDKRLLVKGGITGLAQVSGGYDLSASEKLVYDLEYIEKRSLWLDFVILCKTVLVVLNHNGAR